MFWNQKIKLGKVTESLSYGEPIQDITWTEVYANKRSVRQSEYYEAANLGLKPELVFEVNSFEYDVHEKIQYDGKTFEILRAYEKGEIVELTVGGAVDGS